MSPIFHLAFTSILLDFLPLSPNSPPYSSLPPYCSSALKLFPFSSSTLLFAILSTLNISLLLLVFLALLCLFFYSSYPFYSTIQQHYVLSRRPVSERKAKNRHFIF